MYSIITFINFFLNSVFFGSVALFNSAEIILTKASSLSFLFSFVNIWVAIAEIDLDTSLNDFCSISDDPDLLNLFLILWGNGITSWWDDDAEDCDVVDSNSESIGVKVDDSSCTSSGMSKVKTKS